MITSTISTDELQVDDRYIADDICIEVIELDGDSGHRSLPGVIHVEAQCAAL